MPSPSVFLKARPKCVCWLSQQQRHVREFFNDKSTVVLMNPAAFDKSELQAHP
jgi:hypothetical protein